MGKESNENNKDKQNKKKSDNGQAKNDEANTGDDCMENVISLNQHINNTEKYAQSTIVDNVCEWDVIGDIFSKAIQKKNLSKKQVNDTIKKIKLEVRGK
jgi:hypothetical protein